MRPLSILATWQHMGPCVRGTRVRLGLVGSREKGDGVGREVSAPLPCMCAEEGRWVTGIHGTSSGDAGPGWGAGLVRTRHSQAFQLPQTQEGAGLHRADDVASQVPAGDKRAGLDTSPTRGGGHTARLGWQPLPQSGLGSLFPSKSCSPECRPGGGMKHLAHQMGACGLPGSLVRPAQGGCRRASDRRTDGRTRRRTRWKWEERAPTPRPWCQEAPAPMSGPEFLHFSELLSQRLKTGMTVLCGLPRRAQAPSRVRLSVTPPPARPLLRAPGLPHKGSPLEPGCGEICWS